MRDDSVTIPDAGPDVAIVGLAGRFPGARDVGEYWQNLRDGMESISFFTDDELRSAGVPLATLADPLYVKAAPVLQDADRFDARLFGYTPREARSIDPQHRVFLECTGRHSSMPALTLQSTTARSASTPGRL